MHRSGRFCSVLQAPAAGLSGLEVGVLQLGVQYLNESPANSAILIHYAMYPPFLNWNSQCHIDPLSI